MENNDFRNRLRQHKVTPNQEAWEMMQAMLDSSEDLPEKKKRKRLFFWLWFFGLGFTLLSLFIYQQGDNAMVKNQNYNDSISELPKNTGKTKNDLVDTPNNGNTLNDC